MASTPIVQEGVFAIHKPLGISSAQVIRDAQEAFKSSALFQPWLDREQALKDAESHNQKRKRKSWKQKQPLQVKIGHGGTLDPMATGVLILGVGSGTKSLNRFLECTKSYETVVLFGAATDSYDAVGKLVTRKPYEHVTKETVEEALARFRGKIMQRPPIFSALRVQGKRLYEYAREGKEVPVEIEERPVNVESLEMTEWMDGATHAFQWPDEEAEKQEKDVVEKVLHLSKTDQASSPTTTTLGENSSGTKRKREEETVNGAIEPESPPSPKRKKSLSEPVASGAIQDDPSSAEAATIPSADDSPHSTSANHNDSSLPKAPCPAPAVRLRMTVTSGFYVRSLCHDLGLAVGSAGLMASLVRTRQGDFELSEETKFIDDKEQTNMTSNEQGQIHDKLEVLPYSDLAEGEEVWGPKVQSMLEAWQEREGVVDSDGGGEKERAVPSRQQKREAKPAHRANMRRMNTSSPEA